MSKTFSSLSIPNYRIYFIGLFLTNIGMWMATTAKQWLVLTELTHNDAVALGNLTALIFAPTLLLAPVAGSIADRFPKRTIMLLAQVVNCAIASTLATLVLTGTARLWQVYLLALLEGGVNALCGPAQQAFVSQLVPRKNLSNAIGLNSASFNGARLLGPGVAGVLIATFSTGAVLVVNIVTLVVFFVALLMIDRKQMREVPLARGRGQLKDGARYVLGRPDLLLLLAIAFMMGNFGFNFNISNALMATETFGKGAGEYGVLGSVMGIGALTAALVAARRPRPRLRHIFVAMLVFAIFSAVSAMSPTYVFFAVTLVPLGLAAIMTIVSANSLIQLNCADEYRGRVMTIWSALLVGGTTVVSPAVGLLGNHFGARSTVWFEGIAIALTFVATLSYVMRDSNLRIRVDRHARAPWLRLDRGNVTEDTGEVTK